MTENKRFQIIHLGNPYDFVVKDHNTNKTYGTLQGDDKSLMRLLNELNDENKELKKVLLCVIDELYSANLDLDWEYGTGSSRDELEKSFEEKYGKYGWKND